MAAVTQTPLQFLPKFVVQIRRYVDPDSPHYTVGGYLDTSGKTASLENAVTFDAIAEAKAAAEQAGFTLDPSCKLHA